MLPALTPEILEDKERCGVLDQFETLVLRRHRGQRPPGKEIPAEVELEPEYLKQRKVEEAERRKIREAEDARLDKLREMVMAAGGPQRVWNEYQRRQHMEQMAAMMRQQFSFTQTGTTAGTSNTNFYNAGGGAFFFRS
jgi:hypothetical protein